MAHQELDLSAIAAMNLDIDVRKSLEHAWIEAYDIQRKFEPEHIWSWPELLAKMEDARRSAKMHAVAYGGMDSSILDEYLSVREKLWDRLITILFRFGLLTYIIKPKEKDKPRSDSGEAP